MHYGESIERLSDFDREGQAQVLRLYEETGITRDQDLEALYVLRRDGQIVAAGGLAGQSLRSLAVAPEFEGEGYMALLVSELQERILQKSPGSPIFIVTKASNSKKFISLGFSIVAESKAGEGILPTALLCTPGEAFSLYLRERVQAAEAEWGENFRRSRQGALVMNLNPLTRGHLALIDLALAEQDYVHVFLLSAPESSIPFATREAILRAVAAKRARLCVHPTGPWLVSRASFPGYFFSGSDEALRSQAALDAEIFRLIALELNLGTRYLGTEPYSHETAIYNEIILQRARNYAVRLIPRFTTADGDIISASKVRVLLAQADCWQSPDCRAALERYLPPESIAILTKENGE